MAELVEIVEPTEKEYLIKLTQTEAHLIGGIIADLADNPGRQVYMRYEVDGDLVAPSELSMKLLKRLHQIFLKTEDIESYDYYDYWNPVK